MKTATALLIFALLAALLLRTSEDIAATITHPVDMPCVECHLAKGTIDQTNAGTLVASQEQLCQACHQNALTASHPSGITPSSVPPAIFPLDWKGDLTCSTCHLVHVNTPGKLRVEREGKALCQSCHDEDFFNAMKDGGSSVMAFGHLDARQSITGGIDNFSVQCLTCHDSLDDELRVNVNGEVLRHGSQRISHPIGRRYADAVGYGGYRSIASLSSKIVLPDGKISCISCHQGYDEQHGALVLDNRADGLCFSCHDL
jgi:predicted CXXCH cytochrome family protein